MQITALPVRHRQKPASSGSASTGPANSTNNNRGRRSREFFFGYFLFEGQKESDA